MPCLGKRWYCHCGRLEHYSLVAATYSSAALQWLLFWHLPAACVAKHFTGCPQHSTETYLSAITPLHLQPGYSNAPAVCIAGTLLLLVSAELQLGSPIVRAH